MGLMFKQRHYKHTKFFLMWKQIGKIIRIIWLQKLKYHLYKENEKSFESYFWLSNVSAVFCWLLGRDATQNIFEYILFKDLEETQFNKRRKDIL